MITPPTLRSMTPLYLHLIGYVVDITIRSSCTK